MTSYSNIRFELAKLVVGANRSPDEWISYIVQDNAGVPTRPTTDQNGKLVDNGDGTYVYTFARDIPKVKDQVAAATVPATSNKADLGDLTVDPNAQHRLIIQISGSNAGATLASAANVVHDFIPATGATIPPADLKKDLVDIKACNGCHQALAFHGGGRVDVQYCTTCHTAQRAFGQTQVVSTNLAFPALTETKTVNATTGITSYSYSPNTYVADGEVIGHFNVMIHKIHQGGTLVKQNYNYANVAFNQKGFSMLDNGQRMCTVCHDPALATKASQAFSDPSRRACGACHDGINWATGDGTTARWRHRRPHRSRASRRLAVLRLPRGSHDQGRSPHREPDEEQSGRHGRAGVVHVRDQGREGRAPTTTTIEFRILRRRRRARRRFR